MNKFEKFQSCKIETSSISKITGGGTETGGGSNYSCDYTQESSDGKTYEVFYYMNNGTVMRYKVEC